MPEYDSLHVKITGDARDFERSTKRAEKSAVGFEKKLKDIFARYGDRNLKWKANLEGGQQVEAGLASIQKHSSALRDGRVRIRASLDGAKNVLSELKSMEGVAVSVDGETVTISAEVDGGAESAARLEALRSAASRMNGEKVSLDIEARGAASAVGELSALEAARERAGGRVRIDVDADRDGVAKLSSGFSGLASNIRNTGTILQASRIPFMIAGIGGAIPAITAAAASAGGLAFSLGRAGAGFGLVAGAAGGGALVGLKAYTAGIESTISASREAYEATNKEAVALLEKRRQQILTTEASTAFNREIDRSSIILAKLQAAIGNDSFPFFTRELSAWNTELVNMTPKLAGTAGVISQVAAGFSEWFRTAEDGKTLFRTVGFISDSAISGASALSWAGRAGVMAFQPLIPLASKLQQQINDTAMATSKWVSSAEGQSRLGEIYRSLWTDARRLGGAVRDLGRGVVNVFSAIDASSLDDQAFSGLERISSGFAGITARGAESRRTLNGFLSDSRELMPFAIGAAGAFGAQFGRVANVLIRTRAEGSKLTVLQETFRGLTASARPFGNLLISTFKGLGPEIPKLVVNLSRLAETFAGSSGPLVFYVRVLNRAMGIFNSLPGPVKTLVANMVALKMITGSMGFGGLISGAAQLLINYRLLAGQSKILKVQQAGVAASNTALAGASNAAAGGMSRMAVAGRALRTVMATLVLPVAAVIALGGAFVYAYRHSRTFRDAVDGLGKKLIGASNVATISKRGFAGLGKVLMDNKGASAAFSNGLSGLKKKLTDTQGASGGLRRVLSGVKENLTDARGASVLWRDGLGGLVSKLTDTRGASAGLRSVLAGLRDRIRDNRGASVLWGEGLSGLGRKITDTEGATGKFRRMLGGLHDKITDNRGASAAWADGLPGLKNRLTDTKGASGDLRDVLGDLKTRFTDNRGASRIWATTLPNLRDRLSGVGDESGVLRSTLGNLKERFGEIAESGETRFRQLREAAGRSFGNLLEDSVMFGKSLKVNMEDGFRKAVNGARGWLGGLMYAASRVLSAIGADELASKAKGISEDLKEPLKMARGGVVSQGPTGGVAKDGPRVVYGEAGDEAYARLDRRTPQSDEAVRAIASSPAYGRRVRFMADGGIRYRGPGERGGGDGGSASGRYSGAGKYGIAGSAITTPYGGSSGFGVHYAIDVAAPEGTPIKAVYAGYNYPAPSGNTPYNVWTDYGGLGAHYGHNSAVGKTGPVNPGDTIAYIGSLGNVTGPHAHISVAETFADATKGMWDGIDPENLFGNSYIPGGEYTGPEGGGGVLSSIASSFRDAAEWLKKKANDAMSSFASMIPGFPDLGLGWIGRGVQNGFTGTIVQKASDWIFQKATEKFQGMMGGGISGPAGSGAAGSAQLREWAVKGLNLGDAAPASEDNVSKIVARALFESSGVPTAIQGIIDVNSGGNEARGLMQIIPPTWEANTRPDIGGFYENWMDPVKSVAVASRYMMSRYGQIIGDTGQGYRRGGIIPGPLGKDVMVQAHAGERVLSEDVTRSFDRLANSVSVWSARDARGSQRSSGDISELRRGDVEGRLGAIEDILAGGLDVRIVNGKAIVDTALAAQKSPAGRKNQSENMAREIRAKAGARPESK